MASEVNDGLSLMPQEVRAHRFGVNDRNGLSLMQQEVRAPPSAVDNGLSLMQQEVRAHYPLQDGKLKK